MKTFRYKIKLDKRKREHSKTLILNLKLSVGNKPVKNVKNFIYSMLRSESS